MSGSYLQRAARLIGARLDKLQPAIHRRSTLTRRYNFGDVALMVEVTNPRELSRIEAYRTKEPATLRWIDRYFAPGDVFYDIGANIGLFSIYAAKKHTGSVRFHAFEPE